MPLGSTRTRTCQLTVGSAEQKAGGSTPSVARRPTHLLNTAGRAAQRELARVAADRWDPKGTNQKSWPEDDYLKPLRMEFSRLRWN